MNARRQGFTLIEVMVTTAIAGMTLVVVMGLLGHLGQQISENRVIHQHRPWLPVLKRQLEFDFANCRSIVVRKDEIRLDGYAHCDLETGKTSRIPTLITYRLAGEAGTPSWLVRVEEKLTGDINGSRTTVPVCFGITGFVDLSNLDVDFPPSHWRLRIQIQDDESSEAQPVDLVLFRHGGIRQ